MVRSQEIIGDFPRVSDFFISVCMAVRCPRGRSRQSNLIVFDSITIGGVAVVKTAYKMLVKALQAQSEVAAQWGAFLRVNASD
jgi:hypothetical protein